MRLATWDDERAVMGALLAMLDKSPAPQMRLADPTSARCGVRSAIHEGRAYIVGDFFIMVDQGSPWYTSKPVLIEEIILRISREHDTTVEQAIAALDDIAASRGCVAIAAGDTQIGYMRPKYEARGYVPMGYQLLKGP